MKLVVTYHDDANDTCQCNNCGKVIAQLTGNGMHPSLEECYESGNVPVPNFGWFCSQLCATAYEQQYNITFARTAGGRIDYYTGGF